MLCGRLKVMLPVPPDVITWSVVPDTERTPVFVIVTAPVAWSTDIPLPAMLDVTPVLERVSVPPRDTGEPLTPRPVPPLTVMLLFWSSAFVTTPVERTPLVDCTTPVPIPKTATLPVVLPPMVRVCLLVV